MRNYLRVRGEYVYGAVVVAEGLELPPRARRILRCRLKPLARSGTTSACAENTGGALTAIKSIGNYLRVRGEYSAGVATSCIQWELPPRARRIPGQPVILIINAGTTSACAENTLNELGLL